MHPSALFLLKLLTAHLAGDYLFQSSRLAREKHRPAFLALHLLAHAVLLALVGLTEPSSPRLWLVLLAVLAAHAAIDAATSRRTPRNLRLLSLDQGLHLASLVVAAHVAYRVEPGHALASVGDALGQPGAWLFAAGLLLAVPAGARRSPTSRANASRASSARASGSACSSA